MNQPWIVIPTYNEKENIQRLLEILFNLQVENLHVLVVDDNSPDGTADVVRTMQGTYPNLRLVVREKKAGLGRAYIHGFQFALENGATQLLQMDADFSHDPNDVPRLLKALTEADLALGSRYSHGISVINWPLRRLLISIGGTLYARIITGMPFKDLTGGFKAWRAETMRLIDLPTVDADGYGFQIITTFRAWKNKKRIIEVPIVFTERCEGHSKMNKKIVYEAIWLVWRLRLFGK